MTALSVYALLCGSAFVSATLLPGSSEALLIGFLAGGQGTPALLVLVATVGNVAGSVVNWAIGRFLLHYGDRRWFPVSPRAMARAQVWFARFGVWALLASWVPVVGDPLTLVAGALRAPFARFVLLVTIGKGLRYVALVGAWQLWGWGWG